MFSSRVRSATLSTLLIAAPVVLAGLVLFWFDPSRYAFYPVCIFHKATGLLCPGCGALRAIHQLLHGHLAAALRLNALFVLGLPAVAWFSVRLAVCKWENRPAVTDQSLGAERGVPPAATEPLQRVTPAIRPAWLWCALAVTFLFGILRNLPFAQVAWLAP